MTPKLGSTPNPRADAKRIDRGGERESFAKSRATVARTLITFPRWLRGRASANAATKKSRCSDRARLYRNSGVAARPFIGRFAQIGARAAPRRVTSSKINKSICCKLNRVVARDEGCSLERTPCLEHERFALSRAISRSETNFCFGISNRRGRSFEHLQKNCAAPLGLASASSFRSRDARRA